MFGLCQDFFICCESASPWRVGVGWHLSLSVWVGFVVILGSLLLSRPRPMAEAGRAGAHGSAVLPSGCCSRRKALQGGELLSCKDILVVRMWRGQPPSAGATASSSWSLLLVERAPGQQGSTSFPGTSAHRSPEALGGHLPPGAFPLHPPAPC